MTFVAAFSMSASYEYALSESGSVTDTLIDHLVLPWWRTSSMDRPVSAG
jgi:hypothetical protein